MMDLGEQAGFEVELDPRALNLVSRPERHPDLWASLLRR